MRPSFLAIFAGLASGFLVLASFSGASIAVAYLTLVLPLPMFMAGLGLGTRRAMIAVASGVVVTASVAPETGLAFALMFGLPVWLIVRFALTSPNGVVVEAPEHSGPYTQEGPATTSTFQDRILGRVQDWDNQAGKPPRDLGWFPAGYIAALITALAGVYIIAVAVMTSSHGGLEQAATAYLTEVANMVAGAQGQEVLKEAILRAIPFFPGSVAAFWALSILCNGIMAQALLAKGGRNIRPSPRLRELSLPDWLSWALVSSALIALLAPGEMEYIGRNLTLVLAVPFFFLGLAVVHKLAGMTKFPSALLSLIYVVMIFSGWFILVIAGLGILDHWIGLQSRMDSPSEDP
ncbi:MAG: hypothetical protein COB59_04710 [Rhodospirillaceae bacterium]|nr:MAG: hypothetical protein COB59_04710 [Rhodospirillaceae bacterium]